MEQSLGLERFKGHYPNLLDTIKGQFWCTNIVMSKRTENKSVEFIPCLVMLYKSVFFFSDVF